ncbi:MAG: recombinase family protein [Chloroflexi bacterium]|nr:recombinase family protein [Chloroflexota bacterium]
MSANSCACLASPAKKAVGIWVRVSTDIQVESESPEHHEKRARRYAEAKGWDVVCVYQLNAVSGKSVMGRPETEQMQSDIREGRITGLIFSKLARLARNTKELLEFAGTTRLGHQRALTTHQVAARMRLAALSLDLELLVLPIDMWLSRTRSSQLRYTYA